MLGFLKKLRSMDVIVIFITIIVISTLLGHRSIKDENNKNNNN